VPREAFEKAVLDWLELKRYGPRFIANAGDQVPPHADEARIELMRDLVEKYGRY
jgi:uroporphyrinogen-III decarboxylase